MENLLISLWAVIILLVGFIGVLVSENSFLRNELKIYKYKCDKRCDDKRCDDEVKND